MEDSVFQTFCRANIFLASTEGPNKAVVVTPGAYDIEG